MMNSEQTLSNPLSLVKKYCRNIADRWYLIIPAILLFIYIVLRACRLSLIWDEAYTFFEYVRTPRWWPGGYNYMSANNHLLNTWLMKCSVFFFGESEAALRLPNILSGGIFLFAVARIADRLAEKKWHALMIFLFFAANPYLLDFFSLARGYGISIAMLMIAVWHLIRYVFGKNGLRHALYAQFFLSAALFANLTMIYVFLTISFLLLLNRVAFHREKNLRNSLVILTIIPALTLAALFSYYNHLKSAAALFYGEEISSPAGTFLSLSKAIGYDVFYSGKFIPVLTILFSAIPLIAIIHVMRNALTITRDEKGRWLVFVTLALFFVIVGPLLQHFIFHTNYLSGRTALFYIPLMVLNFTGILIVLRGKIKSILLGIFGFITLIHFAFACNFYYTYDWKEQADVKSMMKFLNDQHIQPAEKCFAENMATELPYERQINYYRMRLGMNNFSHAERDAFIPSCSYYYTGVDGKSRAQSEAGRTSRTIREFPLSRTFLYYFDPAENQKQQLSLVKDNWDDFENEDPYPQLKTDTVYFGNKGTFAGGDLPYSIDVPLDIPDSVHGDLIVSVSCRLYYYTRNTSALLVMNCVNGKENSWEAMHITELSDKPRTWSMTGWTSPVPPGTRKIHCYLWNFDKTPVLMDNVSIRLLRQGG